MCLLADRDLSRTASRCELCGAARPGCRAGRPLLARRTGAPLVPATLHYVGDEMTITFHAPVPHADGDEGLVAMMQGVADAFTAAIRAHPQDWHMMQKVFVDDLPDRR